MTSASKEPVLLQVEGNVVPREKTLEELFPFDMGGGVRFDSNFPRRYIHYDHGTVGDIRKDEGVFNTATALLNVAEVPFGLLEENRRLLRRNRSQARQQTERQQ